MIVPVTMLNTHLDIKYIESLQVVLQPVVSKCNTTQLSFSLKIACSSQEIFTSIMVM